MQAIGAARRYADYREMIVAEAPDVVVVCSRLPGDHFPVIRAAAERGCHILCEKPLTDSLAEADAIATLAERHRIKVAVAHLARHARVFRTMKRMIERGEIGRPLTFYGRGKEDERGGGEDLVVLGTHILDIGLYLFGRPEYVFADVSVDGRPITTGDCTPPTEPIGLCAGDANFWSSFRFPQGVQGVFRKAAGGFARGPSGWGLPLSNPRRPSRFATTSPAICACAARLLCRRTRRITRSSNSPPRTGRFRLLPHH